MAAGKLAILVRNFPLHQNVSEAAVGCQQRIFGAAVKVNKRQRGDAFCRQFAKELAEIVGGARFTVLGSENRQECLPDELNPSRSASVHEAASSAPLIEPANTNICGCLTPNFSAP